MYGVMTSCKVLRNLKKAWQMNRHTRAVRRCSDSLLSDFRIDLSVNQVCGNQSIDIRIQEI